MGETMDQCYGCVSAEGVKSVPTPLSSDQGSFG